MNSYMCYYKEDGELRKVKVAQVEDHAGAISAVKEAYGEHLVVLAVVNNA